MGTIKTAPWLDYNHKPIHELDTIRHPNGETGTVLYMADRKEPWRVRYDDNLPRRLVLRVGVKGQAVVVNKRRPNKKKTPAHTPAETRAIDPK